MLVSTALMPWLGFLVSGFAAFLSIMVIAMASWAYFSREGLGLQTGGLQGMHRATRQESAQPEEKIGRNYR